MHERRHEIRRFAEDGDRVVPGPRALARAEKDGVRSQALTALGAEYVPAWRGVACGGRGGLEEYLRDVGPSAVINFGFTTQLNTVRT